MIPPNKKPMNPEVQRRIEQFIEAFFTMLMWIAAAALLLGFMGLLKGHE